MSRTNSQLITTFIETKQSMELDADKRKFSQFEQTIKTRAAKVKPDVVGDNSFSKAIGLAEKFKSITHHKIDIPEFEQRFDTNVKTGLSNEEAERRLLKDGPNRLS